MKEDTAESHISYRINTLCSYCTHAVCSSFEANNNFLCSRDMSCASLITWRWYKKRWNAQSCFICFATNRSGRIGNFSNQSCSVISCFSITIVVRTRTLNYIIQNLTVKIFACCVPTLDNVLLDIKTTLETMYWWRIFYQLCLCGAVPYDVQQHFLDDDEVGVQFSTEYSYEGHTLATLQRCSHRCLKIPRQSTLAYVKMRAHAR